jgi:hypothetical protein
LRATYVKKYESAFWNLYWSYFRKLALDRDRTGELLSILKYWFEDSLQVFSDLPYLGQSFFLELPSILEDLSKEREFERNVHLITLEAAKYPWFDLVEQYFTGKKKKKLFGLMGK